MVQKEVVNAGSPALEEGLRRALVLYASTAG